MSFKARHTATYERQQRMNALMLLIEPTSKERQELNGLKQLEQPSVALDSDDDLDPECVAARAHAVWTEMYDKAREKDSRMNAFAERCYAKLGKTMNSHGFKQ